VIGDRSAATCQRLWDALSVPYRSSHSFSDFWDNYQKVFPKDRHQSVGKETGQTAHVERWNNTLRQRLARFVRKSLSFSKADRFHEWMLRLFIITIYQSRCDHYRKTNRCHACPISTSRNSHLAESRVHMRGEKAIQDVSEYVDIYSQAD
jgi:IS1 family transposase